MLKINTEEPNIVGDEFLLHRLIYNGHWLLNQQNDFWHLPYEEQYSMINPILQEYNHLNFVWVEEMEAHNLELEQVIRQQPSVPFFTKIGIPITYKTNALGGRGYSKLNHKPILYWVGVNSDKNFEIPETRKFDKHFLYMNRMRKFWREDFFWKMYRNNLLQYCEWSWASHDKTDPLHRSIEGVPIDYEESYREMSLLDEYNTTFVSIVPETLFSDDGVSNDATFITEKTEKCFAAGHPFIMLSTPYFLENLRRLGFKTFSKWWSEEYDKIMDGQERMKSILGTLHSISQWSDEKCEQVYQEMLPILKHNQHRNKELRNMYQTEDKMWLDINDDFDFVEFKKTLV